MSSIPRAVAHRPFNLPAGPAAVVVAHPGHEMRIHAWMVQDRPTVFVLTDGSGHGDRGRARSTALVVDRAGATCGAVFARFTDRQAYSLLLNQRLDEVQRLVLDLAAGLVDCGAGSVLSDAPEGMNPIHDLCFVATAAAAEVASRRLGRRIEHFEFLLDAAPAARAELGEEARLLRLRDDELQRKIQEAVDYEELRPEVQSALEKWGEEAFRFEVIHPVRPDAIDIERRVGYPPFYERFGARRVAEGIYRERLELRRHFLPLAKALRRWVVDAEL